MTATVEPWPSYVGGFIGHVTRFRVVCEDHALSRRVETPEHAVNLANLHNRVDHADEGVPEVSALTLLDPTDPEALWEPGTIDLTAAARWLLLLRSDPVLRGSASASGALGTWMELLGAPDEDTGIDYAERIAHPTTTDRVTAAVAPF